MTHLRYHLQYSWDLKTEQFQRSTLFPTLQHFTLENHPLMHWYLQFYWRLSNVCESVQVRCQMIKNCQGQQCQTYYVFLKGLYVSHVHSCVRLYDIRVNRSIQYFPKPLHWIILLQEMYVRSTVDHLRGLVSSLPREALAASSMLLSIQR